MWHFQNSICFRGICMLPVFFWYLAALFLGPGTPDTGWTFYAPYSFKTGTNMLPAIFGAFVLGIFIHFNRIEFFGYHSPFALPGNEMDEITLVCLDHLRNSLDSVAGHTGCWNHTGAGGTRTYFWRRCFRSGTWGRSDALSSIFSGFIPIRLYIL